MATSGDEVSCDNAITKSNFLESECLAAKSSLKDVKQLNRDQKRRARQLIVAVMAKLQEKEAFIERVRKIIAHNSDFTYLKLHMTQGFHIFTVFVRTVSNYKCFIYIQI